MGANLKEVRERIKSVISTQQITKAMKMVSAAKLRRAQDAIVKMRPYALKLNDMLANIMANSAGDAVTSYGVARDVKKVLIVVVTSNRGLAGAFNTNIIKEARSLMEGKYRTQMAAGNVTILPIGKKGFDYFRKRLSPNLVVKDYVNLFSDLSFDNIVAVPNLLMQYYDDASYDAIEVCYGRFKNAAVQYAEAEQFLPVVKMDKKVSEDKSVADYIYEPDKDNLLHELIPSILQTQLYRFLLDTHASEHGARMTAMDKATENADEILRDLRISYNKA
ncbi:MAG: ATP synthase F1 subunit gamma, partial [Saprospiraceae bacterium]|nr:ATP synthase F1 subunit gamma [Saprospiraceae bacterium]